MKKILILFAHPAFQKSRINIRLTDGISEIEGITFRDLYQVYPDFDIDVPAEQALLESHDVLIFQHPLFWYSTPAILKEWQDLVLEHDWAYGSKGNALKEKWFFSAITTGGRQQAYCREGLNHYTINELLAPIERTIKLCKMNYLPPFVVHGTHSILPEQIEAQRQNYHQLLRMIRDDELDLATAGTMQYLNSYIEKAAAKP